MTGGKNERKNTEGKSGRKKEWKRKFEREWKNKEHVRHPSFLKSQLWICVDTWNEEEWYVL